MKSVRAGCIFSEDKAFRLQKSVWEWKIPAGLRGRKRALFDLLTAASSAKTINPGEWLALEVHHMNSRG